jgi:hypothetical protein
MPTNNNIDIDIEFKDTKLRDYVEIQPDIIRVKDHFRYTSSVYRKPNERKCSYGICEEVHDDHILVKGYKSSYKPWRLKFDDKNRNLRFYMREKDLPVDKRFVEPEKPMVKYLVGEDMCAVCGNYEDQHLVKCEV